MKKLAEHVTVVRCEECGHSNTTPSDNTLLKTGGFKCTFCDQKMNPVAKYKKVSEEK